MNCKEWLRNSLMGKSCILCADIRQEAKCAGYSKKDLREARVAIGVRTFHQLNDDGDNHFWYLEEHDA